MADRLAEIQSEARLSLHYIPSGRQLPRTPPLATVKKQLDFCNEDSNQEHEELQQSVEVHTDGIDQEDDIRNTMYDFNTLGIKSEPDDPSAMLRGMTGYQLTQTDSEFMEKMRVEKLVKKLKGDLEELQRSFVKENTLLKLASVSRKEALAGLQALPSGEDLTEWVKVILKITSPHTDVADLDAKSLLAMVTRKDIERAMAVTRMLIRVQKRVAHAKLITPTVKGQLEQLVAVGQLEIQGLMRELSDLKSELSQLEKIYKTLKMQLIGQEAPEVPAEEEAAKRPATRPVKESANALAATETLQDPTKRSKPTRSKLGDSLTVVKDDDVKVLKTKAKSGAAAQKKRAGRPRQKAEAPESNSQESVRRNPLQGKPQAALQGKPQAALQGKPQAALQGKPQAALQGKPQAALQGKPQAALQGKPQAALQGKPQAALQGKPQAALQGKPQAALQGKPQAALQGKPQAALQGKPQAALQGKPQAALQGKPRAALQGKPQAALQGKPQAALQGKPQGPADAGVALSSSLQGRKRSAEEEAQPPALRRSKRIASRR